MNEEYLIKMITIKEWLNANVWDGEDRSGTADKAVFTPDELLELITEMVEDCKLSI